MGPPRCLRWGASKCVRFLFQAPGIPRRSRANGRADPRASEFSHEHKAMIIVELLVAFSGAVLWAALSSRRHARPPVRQPLQPMKQVISVRDLEEMLRHGKEEMLRHGKDVRSLHAEALLTPSRRNAPLRSMSEYHKCTCPHCGQSIEYPAEGTGQTVPCPTCEKPFVLLPDIVIPSAKTTVAPLPTQEPMEQKRGRSNLYKLTEETIRARTKAGNTPLHMAAKNGQFGEIPRHLLSIELFTVKNRAGETPLHVAAKCGHLDQVPPQFLTKDTMTMTSGIDVYLTGSGYQARTETVLHAAASNNHADQIPKEFLTPEFLLIEATGHRQTVLEHIVSCKRLDLLPGDPAGSELWNVKNADGQTARAILQILLQREAQLKEGQADRAAYVERVRSEPATEKQKEKLCYFGYSVKSGMTKGEASDAIDDCIRLHPEKDREYYDRPATEQQMAQLRESAKADKDLAEMFEELDEEGSALTYGQAKDLIRDSERDAQQRENDRFSNPPDESQLEEFGFKLDTHLKDIITSADLDEILSLKGAPPRQVDLSLFEQHGMTFTQGDGLAAFALGDLIRAFGGSVHDHNRKPLNYPAACQTAGSDPDFQTPVLTRDWEGFVAFSWPKAKIREWRRGSRRG